MQRLNGNIRRDICSLRAFAARSRSLKNCLWGLLVRSYTLLE